MSIRGHCLLSFGPGILRAKLILFVSICRKFRFIADFVEEDSPAQSRHFRLGNPSLKSWSEVSGTQAPRPIPGSTASPNSVSGKSAKWSSRCSSRPGLIKFHRNEASHPADSCGRPHPSHRCRATPTNSAGSLLSGGGYPLHCRLTCRTVPTKILRKSSNTFSAFSLTRRFLKRALASAMLGISSSSAPITRNCRNALMFRFAVFLADCVRSA